MPFAELLDPALAGSRPRIVVKTDYADRYLIRMCPGAAYSSEHQEWRVPLSWASCITLRGLFEDRLEVGEGLAEWARREFGDRIGPAQLLRDKLTFDDEILKNPAIDAIGLLIDHIERDAELKLHPYQRVDVAYLVMIGRGILANDMGVGKTASCIRAMQVMRDYGYHPFPALVVCPNTVKETWAGELLKFAPELRAVVVGGPMGVRRKQLQQDADIFIVNWDALRLHSRLAGYGAMALTDTEKEPKELNQRGFQTVIADEAHKAKDPHSKQTRALWAISREAQYRYCVTGTPVASNVGDLWSLLHAIEPEGFPAKNRYLERYARIELGFFGGQEILGLKPETTGEFHRVTAPLMRRVPKEAALPQLPEKLPVVYRFTDMTPAQARLYRQMEQNMIAEIWGGEQDGAMISAPNAIAKLTRLLQFASASATVDDENKVHLALPSAKVDDLAELLEEMGDQPLVVAAVSSQLINLAAQRLEKEGIRYGLITGAQSTDERQAWIEAFQDGKIRVILMTIGAGAEGITLTKASTLLFMQRSWSKTANDQAEARVHRHGQKSPVLIIDQVTPGTVEYRKIRVLGEKEERIEEVVRDKDTLLYLLGG